MAIIAVNTRLLQKGKLEGIGWFTFETLKRITQNHPEHTFYFLFDRPYHLDFKFASNVHMVWFPPPTRHVFLFFPWFEVFIPIYLKWIKADVFLSPDGSMSLLSNVPTVNVIHDINFHHHPEQLPGIWRWYYNTFFPRYARKAKRIATVSEYTKNDLVNSYGITANKIDVTFNGVNSAYRPLGIEKDTETRQKYSGGSDYFLFIGLIIPRKNLLNLMKAFEMFRAQHPSNMKLIVVGSRKWWDASHEEVYAQHSFKEDIIFLGRMQADELHHLLSAAFALTFVPFFEGFGIPVLEAFQCGTPVITSNITSLPEVAGDAALLADPYSPEQIAQAMMQLVNDENLRHQLIQKGKIRALNFSWDKTADILWNCIEKALKE